jgi:polar amino acid transport system permease protein
MTEKVLSWYTQARRTTAVSTSMDIVKFVLLMAVLTWLTLRGTERLGYNWQWYRIPAYIFSVEKGAFVTGPLLDGLLLTLRITGISLILAFVFGLVTALLRLSRSLVARMLARGYLEFIRNTPLLVQIFFIYFVLAPVLDISRFTSAVLALSLFEGAYASEIFRAGIVSIHKEQWEAAYSTGLSTFQTYRFVLTMQGQAIIAETFLTFEIWFTVAAIYFLITATLSLVVGIMENRFTTPT